MRVRIILLIFLLSTIYSCNPLSQGGDGGTTAGDPKVDVTFEPYEASLVSKIQNLFIKDAYAGVNNLSFCFKRIRFKSSDTDIGSDIELDVGEIIVKPEGTVLGQVEVMSGTYKRVEFDLQKDCDGTTKPSISIMNDNGTYSTEDRMTIKFEGNFDSSKEDLGMFVQNFIDVLKNYTPADGELKDVLEGVSGTF